LIFRAWILPGAFNKRSVFASVAGQLLNQQNLVRRTFDYLAGSAEVMPALPWKLSFGGEVPSHVQAGRSKRSPLR